MTMHPVTKALALAKTHEGYQARKAGKSEEENPYPKGSDARVWWNMGWIEADSEKK